MVVAGMVPSAAPLALMTYSPSAHWTSLDSIPPIRITPASSADELDRQSSEKHSLELMRRPETRSAVIQHIDDIQIALDAKMWQWEKAGPKGDIYFHYNDPSRKLLQVGFLCLELGK